MKNVLTVKTFLFAMGCSVFIFVMGCQETKPNAKKSDTAIAETTKDVELAVNEVKEKVEDASEKEWKLLIDEMQQKIKEDEKTMERLKAKMKVTGKKLDSFYLKQIDQLEQRFDQLQQKMKKSDKSKKEWAAYKEEFDRDMLKMKDALKKVAE